MITTTQLKGMSLAQLEELYAREDDVDLPTGFFNGQLLQWLDTRDARHPLWRPAIALMFEACPFGVDFTNRRWFFFQRSLAAGRFEARVEPSRWRDTRAVCLHYEGSRLPGPIRGVLYDEVKPLNRDLCLGLGGINRPGSQGDIFFFALQRAGQ